MLKRFLLISSIYFVVAGCGPSTVELTSTALVAKSLTETAAPTITPVPTITSTATATAIPTVAPSPTPIGGGTGRLLFFVNPWQDGPNLPPSERDGLYAVNSDGTGLKQILSRSEIETLIGKKYKIGDYLSYAGQNYVFAGELYSVTDDWTLIYKTDVPKYGLFRSWREYVSYAIRIVTIAGWQNKKLLGANDSYVGLSADGSTVYLQKDQGATMWAINSDGSNKRQLELMALENYIPYEGAPLPEGVISMGTPIRRLDTYAVSPDGTEVAFTWADLLFVANAADIEFSAPRLINRLPNNEPELDVFASELIWSPDNNTVLIKLTKYGSSVGSTWGDIILVDLKSGEFETIISSTEFNHKLCGFSPDGRVIVSRYQNYPEKKSVLVLTSLDDKSSITIPYDGGSVECPTWQ
jgi:hypothetical protein